MRKSNNSTIRINKRLVQLGLVNSRRAADVLVDSGAVKINGVVAKNGDQVDVSDKVELNNVIGSRKSDITIMFNKPVGYTCSHVSQNNDTTIFSLLPSAFASLKIAGRLDRDSCGLLILSSNGDLIQALTHPSNNKLKHYIVKLKRTIASSDILKLKKGVKLVDGISTFKNVTIIKPNTLRVSIAEGRNRQIRRTFEGLGYRVIYLERIQIADFSLGSLQPAKYEFIDTKKALKAC